MGNISKHFNRSEIECKCGCGLNTMDAETLKIADECREWYGRSITPSSGARCLQHNRNIGSTDTSQHVLCRAIDLPVNDPRGLYTWLCERYPNGYGFGLYEDDGFVHIDTKSGPPRRWAA